jgi:hypothetical protein
MAHLITFTQTGTSLVITGLPPGTTASVKDELDLSFLRPRGRPAQPICTACIHSLIGAVEGPVRDVLGMEIQLRFELVGDDDGEFTFERIELV